MREGHKYKVSNNKEMNDFFMYFKGHTKKSIYAWVKSNGDLLCVPDDNLDKILALEEEIRKCVEETRVYASLVEFYYDSTHKAIFPILEKRTVGGSSIGGYSLETLDDILKEFKKIFERLYAQYGNTRFYIEENSVFIEHNNVRAWVTKSDNLGKDGVYNLPYKWSAYVTMIKRWNDEYHDVHLGDFRHGSSAIEEAFAYFIKFQMQEMSVEDM